MPTAPAACARAWASLSFTAMSAAHDPYLAGLPAFVRAGDYQAFLAIQYAPAAQRAPLYLLSALAIEVARSARISRESLVCALRVAWWREQLQQLRGEVASHRHPLLAALAQHCHELPEFAVALARFVDVVFSDEQLPDAARCGRALQEAWHRYLSGGPADFPPTPRALHVLQTLVARGAEPVHTPWARLALQIRAAIAAACKVKPKSRALKNKSL